MTDTYYPEYLTRELFSSGGEIEWFHFHSSLLDIGIGKGTFNFTCSAYIVRPTEVNLWYCSAKWETGHALALFLCYMGRPADLWVSIENQTAPSPLSAVTVMIGHDRLLSIYPSQVPQCRGVSVPWVHLRGPSSNPQGTSTDITSLPFFLPSYPSVALNVWGRELTPYFALLAIVRSL